MIMKARYICYKRIGFYAACFSIQNLFRTYYEIKIFSTKSVFKNLNIIWIFFKRIHGKVWFAQGGVYFMN